MVKEEAVRLGVSEACLRSSPALLGPIILLSATDAP